MDYQSVYGNSYGEDEMETEGLYLLDTPVSNYDRKQAQTLAKKRQMSRDMMLVDQMRYGYPSPHLTQMATKERFRDRDRDRERDRDSKNYDEIIIDNKTLLYILLIICIVMVCKNSSQPQQIYYLPNPTPIMKT